MSRTWDLDALIEFLEGDREVVDRLLGAGLLVRTESGVFSAEDAEVARVARTLVRELEVNWEGIEVILQMRSELLATRRQLVEVVEYLRVQRGLPRTDQLE